MAVLHHYDSNHLPISASRIVPIVNEIHRFDSVIDVGCGIGQWLSVFEENGVGDILGMDGHHVPKDSLLIDRTKFKEVDLTNPKDILVNRKFDLVISLEVAEHLPRENAEAFVNFLTRMGDTILFSAAVPNQTGENHLNEQWPEYWVNLFKRHDYICLDILRSKIWNDDKINWWYRQNIFIITKEPDLISRYQNFEFDGRSIIHPALFDIYVNMYNELGMRKSKGLLGIIKERIVKLIR